MAESLVARMAARAKLNAGSIQLTDPVTGEKINLPLGRYTPVKEDLVRAQLRADKANGIRDLLTMKISGSKGQLGEYSGKAKGAMALTFDDTETAIFGDCTKQLPAPEEKQLPAPDGEKPDGEKPDGEKPDGEKPDGEKPDGEKPDGEKPEEKQLPAPDGEKPADPK